MLVPKDFIAVTNHALESAHVIQFPRKHILPRKSDAGTRLEQLKSADVYVEEEHYWLPFFESKDWMSLPQFWKYACTYGLGVRRKNLEQVGIFREVFKRYGFEDTELAFRLARSGAQFDLVPQTIFHLTPPVDKSRYRHSQMIRQLMLAKTAKIFFLSTLDPEIYHFTRHYLRGESRWTQKIYELFN